jgi:uncharacterized protein YkwD
VAALDEEREARRLPRLRRDAVLDEVAARRARETAALPESQRLGEKAPIEALIRAAGRRRFTRAVQYLAYQGGYADDAAAAVRTWKGYAPGWERAMEGAWAEAGAATARASDGTLVIVVVLLEPSRPAASIESTEEAIAAAVNRERAARGLDALAPDERLARVARAHSEAMLRLGFFDHVSPDGAHPADRAGAAEIAFRKIAENIFESRHAEDPVASALAGWMASAGHRENILDPTFTHTGVGVAMDLDEGAFVVTQLFLRPQAAPEPDR